MKETAERFKELLTSLRFTNHAFAREIGVSATVINGIVNGEHKPGPKVLAAINQRFPDINTDWLLIGIGQMSRTDINPKTATGETFGAQLLERLLDEFAKLREQLSIKDKQLEAADKRAEGLQRTVDSLINRVTAGNFPKPVTRTGKNLTPAPKNNFMPVSA